MGDLARVKIEVIPEMIPGMTDESDISKIATPRWKSYSADTSSQKPTTTPAPVPAPISTSTLSQ